MPPLPPRVSLGGKLPALRVTATSLTHKRTGRENGSHRLYTSVKSLVRGGVAMLGERASNQQRGPVRAEREEWAVRRPRESALLPRRIEGRTRLSDSELRADRGGGCPHRKVARERTCRCGGDSSTQTRNLKSRAEQDVQSKYRAISTRDVHEHTDAREKDGAQTRLETRAVCQRRGQRGRVQQGHGVQVSRAVGGRSRHVPLRVPERAQGVVSDTRGAVACEVRVAGALACRSARAVARDVGGGGGAGKGERTRARAVHVVGAVGGVGREYEVRQVRRTGACDEGARRGTRAPGRV